MLRFTFIRSSKNGKLGNIPSVYVARDSCPPSCGFYNDGCYARGGMVRMHWDRVNDNGISFNALLTEIKKLPNNQLWRYGVAGDLPGHKENINLEMLKKLVDTNKGKRGYAYTHKNPTILENNIGIMYANDNGFTINLSSNNAAQADEYLSMNIAPVVTVMPHDSVEQDWKNSKTPAGNMIVRCPAEYNEKTNCSNCGGVNGALCSRRDRKYVIGFTAHGAAKNKASAVAKKHLNIVE
jgi:hypothetical protein